MYSACVTVPAGAIMLNDTIIKQTMNWQGCGRKLLRHKILLTVLNLSSGGEEKHEPVPLSIFEPDTCRIPRDFFGVTSNILQWQEIQNYVLSWYIQSDTKKRELLKNPTTIEEIQEKKIIDRN